MKKPNIILFLTDGHRAEALGCYGNRLLQTPNIDAFAGEGARLRRAYCSHTVCMPTRASIFTGRYPHCHGVWANGITLPTDEVTLPQVLAEHGYATFATGKIHFEPQQPYEKYAPIVDTPYYGFQEVHLSENRRGVEYVRFVEENFPELVKHVAGDGETPPGAEVPRHGLPEDAHDLQWITDQAIDFVGRQAQSDAPFFASCSFHELIPPCRPPLTFMDMYDPDDLPLPEAKGGELVGKPPYQQACYDAYLRRNTHPDEAKLRQVLATYYAQASFLDKQFGRLMAALEAQGLADNTIVLFTADHGLMLTDHHIWRHGPFLYEQVINVPMIWRVPGETAGGTVLEELVESVDIMPTLLDLAGVAAPAGVQGRSIRGLLAGAAGAAGRESVLVQDRESPELLARGIDPTGFSILGIRTADWKLNHYPGRPYGELYDLKNDPGEFANLWADPGYVPKRMEMERLLFERYLAARDPLPVRTHEW
ncbi:MAG: sulfatase-like hydrolase/transferase [Kiritimatiellae bacterium]|nr:sulfatase-like hydrolase/transferase [Kiritimatiellia bacterium]